MQECSKDCKEPSRFWRFETWAKQRAVQAVAQRRPLPYHAVLAVQARDGPWGDGPLGRGGGSRMAHWATGHGAPDRRLHSPQLFTLFTFCATHTARRGAPRAARVPRGAA